MKSVPKIFCSHCQQHVLPVCDATTYRCPACSNVLLRSQETDTTDHADSKTDPPDPDHSPPPEPTK